jgi:thymidylate kinase
MIIELFGPAGSGKTTLAHALTSRLREKGYIVEPILSYRPAEVGLAPVSLSRPAGHRVGAVPRRLSRPLLEVLAIVCHPVALPQDVATAIGLMKILPPRSMAAAVRLSQYILRLSHSWHRASATGHIVLFDQAFVQLICSPILFSRFVNDSLIADALDMTPRADLAIRLDAPRDVLAARLEARKCQQSAFERLFEADLNTNLKSIDIVDRLHRLLIERGELVVCASSLDQQSLNEAVKATEGILAARFGTALQSPAEQRLRAVNLVGKAAI